MVSGNKDRKCCVSDKFPAWTQPANKMKLQILLRNFTSYPTQSKNTEASKSDKEENSFAAGACAKNKPCKWVTSFPNPSSNVTFCTSCILTFIGLQDVRAQECQIQTPPANVSPQPNIAQTHTGEGGDSRSCSGLTGGAPELYCTWLQCLLWNYGCSKGETRKH